MASATGIPNPTRAWEALTPPLSEWILNAVSDMGYKRMTPVQASTIPEFMRHRDVVVEAVTGSGKTLAYLIPVVERLLRLEEPLKKHHVGAIIISPTRELAAQIYTVLQNLLAFHGPSAAAVRPIQEAPDGDITEDRPSQQNPYSPSTLKIVPQLLLGGTTTTAQDLRHFLEHSPNLIISTPGRLLELLSSPHVHCPQLSFEVLVLDEADRLLDLGFKEDLQKILGRLPKQRRTGLFSASVSEAVDQLVRVGLRNSKKITVKVRGLDGAEDRKTPSSLHMHYLVLPASQKFPAISKLLSTLEPTPSKIIIFLSTCASVDYFQHLLPSILPSPSNQPFPLIPLHGKQPSKLRQKNFLKFSTSTTPSILLTTDVAARGLDIPQVDLILQIDPPSDAKVFLHRCGRAGRAGRKGLSLVFLLPGREEAEYPGFLSRRSTPVTPLPSPALSISAAEALSSSRTMRTTVLGDRSLHDKAQRAFPSWVQAFRKHQASHIFRLGEIDWEDMAQAWALLRLPRMPELPHHLKGGGEGFLGLEIDFTRYSYRDPQREKVRLQGMQEGGGGGGGGGGRAGIGGSGGGRVGIGGDDTQSGAVPGSKKGVKRAWSTKTEVQEERQKRREKKRVKKAGKEWAGMTPEEKEERRRLEAMIEEVKRRRREEGRMEEFGGFDD